jgi:ferric-dicitrate binding protein FerR (iron transport regulator)
MARVKFDKTPLGLIIERANTIGRPSIRIDARVARLPVTGILDLRDTHPLAAKLASALDLRLVQQKDALFLTR